MKATSPKNEGQWSETHAYIAAFFITLLAFLARLWVASGTFLNPDEALHFRLANQPTLVLAYEASLTASHPPLLTFVLYFWRTLGTSELWLRLPSVLAGTAFCWLFYKWLAGAAGKLAGLIGLLFVAFLRPIVLLSAEIRQYALLLVFLAGALYFLDEAFAEKSPGKMAAFSLSLYLAMLSHYSAFLFAAALAIYAVVRVFQERFSASLVGAWTIGQLGALALAIFLYKTHLSKLGAGESRSVLQGWMSEFFLRRSYFDRAHDNPLIFLAGHSFGVFQYFFGQLAVGDVMGLLFVVGAVLLLLCRDGFPERRTFSRSLG
ncbi:MAG: glycosyltransferase family 39 protein, partial [Candidatus Sulfotelmatobacter sp.]